MIGGNIDINHHPISIRRYGMSKLITIALGESVLFKNSS
jgi:hypothetical protein